jgi:hypothetical protein
MARLSIPIRRGSRGPAAAPRSGGPAEHTVGPTSRGPVVTRPSSALPQQGCEELLSAGAAIARGVAPLGQGDELRLGLLTQLLAERREQLLAHHLLHRHHPIRRELLQQRLGEGGLGLITPLVLPGMRAAEPDETRAEVRLPLLVFLAVTLVA